MVKAVFPYYYELEEFLQDRRVGLGVPDILGAQDSEVEETVEEEEDETRHVESTPTEVPVSTSVVETVSDSSEDEATVAPPAKKAKKSSGAATFDQDFKSILDEPVDTTIYSQMLEKKQEMAKMKMKVQQLTETRLILETLLKSGLDPTSSIVQDLMKKIMELLNNAGTSEPEAESSNLS